MAEDSGAFKTNQGNSAQIGHFVIAGDRPGTCSWDRCGKDASGARKTPLAGTTAPSLAHFITNSFETLRYLWR